MRNQRRGRSVLASHGVPVALLFASLLTLSVSTKQIVRLPVAVASTVASAVQFVFMSAGDLVRRTVFSIRELSNLRQQYNEIADKLTEYKTLERDIAELRSENDRLREQLGFARNMTQVIASARIIAKDPTNLYTSYEIDKGAVSGISRDMAVAAFQDGFEGLAGKTIDVRMRGSKVLPLYDRRFYVSARISRTRTEGLLNGNGEPGGLLSMRYISKLGASELQIGDLVVTSGLDSIFPPDLAIGRVSGIELPEYGSSAVVSVTPVLDFSRLEYLFILSKAEADSETEYAEVAQ